MSKEKRCVVIGGAGIKNYNRIKEYLCSDDYNIFCDCGLRHKEALEIEPQLIVGDFDSFQRPETNAETIVLPCEKDDTDTVFAVKEAMKRGFRIFLLIGMIGERLDHTLGNLSALLMLQAAGCRAVIVDDYSEMEIVSAETAYVSDSFAYFSLLSISGTAKGVNIKNAKYPLTEAEITCDYQYGISNEVLPGKTAEISVSEGNLLLIKVI